MQKLQLINYTSEPKNGLFGDINERYWLNSNGVFVFVNKDIPLFINQNIAELKGFLCLNFKFETPYNNFDNLTFDYKIGIASDARMVHLEAIRTLLKRTLYQPDEHWIVDPTWSTCARNGSDSDQSLVSSHANKIMEYQLEKGQLELNDNWETCPGALEFDSVKYSNINSLTEDLKENGFRISLWVPPFINKDCEPWYSEAQSKG